METSAFFFNVEMKITVQIMGEVCWEYYKNMWLVTNSKHQIPSREASSCSANEEVTWIFKPLRFNTIIKTAQN